MRLSIKNKRLFSFLMAFVMIFSLFAGMVTPSKAAKGKALQVYGTNTAPTVERVDQQTIKSKNNFKVLKNAPLGQSPTVQVSDPSIKVYENLDKLYSTVTTNPWGDDSIVTRYDRNNFPKRDSHLTETIYPKFQDGYQGLNVHIPLDVLKNDPDVNFSVTFPGNAALFNGNNLQELVDVKATFSNFIYRDIPDRYDRGNKTNIEGNMISGIAFSISNAFGSGWQKINAEAFEVSLEFVGAKSGQPIDMPEEAYITFGSLNASHGHPGSKIQRPGGTGGQEFAGYLNQDPSKKVFLLNGTPRTDEQYFLNAANGGIEDKNIVNGNVVQLSYESFASRIDAIANGAPARNMLRDHPNNAFFDGVPIFAGGSNEFIDDIEAHNYMNNAVTFQLNKSNPHRFIMGNYVNTHGRPVTVNQETMSASGWAFMSTATVFNGGAPDPEKTVSDSDEIDVTDNIYENKEELIYRIKQTLNTLGQDTTGFYTQFGMKDELPEEVDFVSAVISVDGQDRAEMQPQYDPATHTVSYDTTDSSILGEMVDGKPKYGLFQYNGEEVILEIVVKPNDKADAVEFIRNEGIVTIDNNPNTTNEVTSRDKDKPDPPTDPNPDPNPVIKKVEGQERYETPEDKEYEYTVTVKVPENIDQYTKFNITDKLEDVLEFVSAKVTIDGQEEPTIDVKEAGNLVTASATDFDALIPHVRKNMVLHIVAKIKPGADLSAYTNNEIPNKATLSITDENGIDTDTDSNTVIVIPPTPDTDNPDPNKPTPQIKKDVEGKDHLDVDREKEYTYNVTIPVPDNIGALSRFDIVDDIDPGLTLVDADVLVDGQKSSGMDLTISGNNVTVETKDFAALQGKKEVVVSITAKINKGTDISQYENGLIPNKALLFIDENPQEEIGSVIVRHELIDENDQVVSVIEYEKVKDKAPVGEDYETQPKTYPNYEFVRKTSDSDPEKGNVIKGVQTVVYQYRDTSDPDNKGSVNVIYVVKDENNKVVDILEGPNEVLKNEDIGTPYDTQPKTFTGYDFVEVDPQGAPEKGSAKEEDQLVIMVYKPKDTPTPGVPIESNVVTVTPNPDPNPSPKPGPKIKKDVEKKEHLDIERNIAFEFNITTTIPEDIADYEVFRIVDNLDEGLNVMGYRLSVDGVRDEGDLFEVGHSGQNVKAEALDPAKLAGKSEVVLTINASIKNGVDMTQYEDGKIPNTSEVEYKRPHDPNIIKEPSNKVTVTPKVDPIKKNVEGKTEHRTAAETNFQYNIFVEVPTNAHNFKELEIIDELEKDLTPISASAFIGDQKSDNFDVAINGNKVSIKAKDLSKLEGVNEIKVGIVSKINKDIDLSKYEDGKVPNVAILRYVDPNGDEVTFKSNVVHVVPVNPLVLKKDVEGKELHETKAGENFKYNIYTELPADASEFDTLIIQDQLVEELSFVEAKVLIDGQETKAASVNNKGNYVEAKILDFEALEDKKEVRLVITAQVKKDADLSKYKDGLIPNIAKMIYGKPGESPITVESNTVHVRLLDLKPAPKRPRTGLDFKPWEIILMMFGATSGIALVIYRLKKKSSSDDEEDYDDDYDQSYM